MRDFTVAALAAIFTLLPTTAACQDPASDPAGGGTALANMANVKGIPKGPAPRSSDGKPDLSGIWTPDRTFIYDISSALKPGETLTVAADKEEQPCREWLRIPGKSCRRPS